MGTARFLVDNLITSDTMLTVSSERAGQVGLAVKVGSGSATLTPGGPYTGATPRQYIVEVSDVSAGAAVGSAKYRWRPSDVSDWSATGVATSAAPTVLESGITVAWVSGGGTDFIAGDYWTITVDKPFGKAKLLDRDRDTEWRSADDAALTIIVDLGSPGAVQVMALLDHNLTAAATITLEANTANSWATPAWGPFTVTRQAENLIHTVDSNIATNGGMEGTYGSGMAPGVIMVGTCTPTESADAYTGSQAQQVTGSEGNNYVRMDVAVVVGRQYRAGVYAKRVSGTGGNVNFNAYDGVTDQVAQTTSSSYTKLEKIITPATATLHLCFGCDSAGDVARFDAAYLEEITTPGAQTYRYWRLSLTDAANPDGYLRIGSLFLGAAVEFSRNYAPQWSRGPVAATYGPIGALRTPRGVWATAETISLVYRAMAAADRTKVLAMFDALYSPTIGTVRPILVNLDSADAADVSLYELDTPELPVGSQFVGLYEWSARLRQRPRIARSGT